LNLKPLD